MKKSVFWVLLVCVSCLVIGCADNKAESSYGSAVTYTESLTETQVSSDLESTTETEGHSAIDRYGEILDRSACKDKLSLYFLKLETLPDTEEGSGDSMIMITPDEKVIVIDFGHPDTGSIITGFLKDMGIEKIDYAVVTHPHIDHIGGFKEVADTLEISLLYTSELRHETKTYTSYLDTIEQHQIPVEYLKKGDELQIGEHIHVKVFNPEVPITYPKNFPESSTQFMNDQSLLLKFTYGESVFLNGGDLYRGAERDLISKYGDELKADVLKANHHGKDTSNSKNWIKTVSPELTVAMNDKSINMTVYQGYLDSGSEYHFTGLNGIVRVLMDSLSDYEVLDQYDSWINKQ